MKTYALINSLNSNIETLFSKEGVKDRTSIYPFCRYKELYEILEPNDKVVIPSIKVFNTVGSMIFVINELAGKGVSFTSIQEVKLSFTTKNPLRLKYRDYISGVLNSEETMINKLQQIYYKHINVNDMCNGIHMLCLELVSKTFRADGILQR